MSPQYVGCVDAVKLFFSNYTNFKGRSTRSEYWWWVLANVIVLFVLQLFTRIFPSGLAMCFRVIMGLYSLGTIVPNIALSIRRMHDVGKSGWWILISAIPLVGWVIYIYFAIQPSAATNEWGEPAKN